MNICMPIKAGDSHFWQGLMEVRDIFYWFCTKKIGNGKQTLFWEDNWIGGRPLALQYPTLYNLTNTKQISVHEVLLGGWDKIKFRRVLHGDKLADWNFIKQHCEGFQLQVDKKDRLWWNLTKNGLFTVKSLYRALKLQQTACPFKKFWNIKVPLKIRIFLWLFLKNKILTKDNLYKRGWRKGDKICQFCCREESIQHLFFDCPFAKLIWNVVTCALDLKPILDKTQLFSSWSSGFNKNMKNLLLVGVSATIWAIWKTRNKACFDNILPKDPIEVIFMICHLIESCAVLQNLEANRRKLELGGRVVKQVASDVFNSRYGWRPCVKRLE